MLGCHLWLELDVPVLNSWSNRSFIPGSFYCCFCSFVVFVCLFTVQVQAGQAECE